MAFCSTWNVNSHYKLIHSQSNFDGVVVECIHYIYKVPALKAGK